MVIIHTAPMVIDAARDAIASAHPSAKINNKIANRCFISSSLETNNPAVNLLKGIKIARSFERAI
jgi:hypothetical protein